MRQIKRCNDHINTNLYLVFILENAREYLLFIHRSQTMPFSKKNRSQTIKEEYDQNKNLKVDV
jgi:hypothetical protein